MSIDRGRLVTVVALLVLASAALRPASGQRHPPKTRADSVRDSTLSYELTAGEADDEDRPRAWLKRLKFNLGFTTLHIGGGLLVDYIGYEQDSASKEQFRLVSQGKFRDGRILTGGTFKTKRPFTWQVGIMYDAVQKKWLFRQTGLMVSVPEIWSHFFVGRAKEGFSLNKVMVGYDGWAMERMPFTDATIPLLADGFKWLGYIPDKHVFWNFGAFTDVLSEGQTFSTYNNQFVLRLGWIPTANDTAGQVIHLAMNVRAGDINNDTLLLKSKPEAFPAPNFVSTGSFPAQTAWTIGPEIYYRSGRILLGTEYYYQKVRSREFQDPWFYGGNFIFTWLTTGETRPYNSAGNYFKGIAPDKTVIQGGPGAWEPVITYSFTNLTKGALQGGTLWRVTPMINWYLTDNLRLEFAYGVAKLNRFGVTGLTQFYQSRFQFQL